MGRCEGALEDVEIYGAFFGEEGGGGKSEINHDLFMTGVSERVHAALAGRVRIKKKLPPQIGLLLPLFHLSHV